MWCAVALFLGFRRRGSELGFLGGEDHAAISRRWKRREVVRVSCRRENGVEIYGVWCKLVIRGGECVGQGGKWSSWRRDVVSPRLWHCGGD